MKTKLNTLRNFPLLVLISFLSTATKPADDCKAYWPMKEGVKMEIKHYNKKDKLQSRSEYEILNRSEGSNSLSATVGMKSYDKKDELIFDNDYEVRCEDGVFKIDIQGVLNGSQLQQMESMKDMEVSIDGNDLVMPANMNVGDELPDGSLSMSVSSSAPGMGMMNFTTKIKNRKVEARESVTTEAGTFDCVVITADVETKMSFMSITFQSKDWYAEEVGMVRSESYNKGKLQGYSLLTKFEQ